DLGTFEDPLQPGALQVLKQLGTDEGPVAWPDDAPSVTFYICSTGADSTELTIDDCNAGTADVVIAVPDDGNPAESGPLAEGYYTVCEAVPAGYEVDDQCQVVDVVAGDTADA